jgi:hypothetical protein
VKLKNISGQPRDIPALGVTVYPDAAFTAPAEWAAGALYQVWWWEAADDEAAALAASHPEWWDHPYVAEVSEAGGQVATKPRATARKDGA